MKPSEVVPSTYFIQINIAMCIVYILPRAAASCLLLAFREGTIDTLPPNVC